MGKLPPEQSTYDPAGFAAGPARDGRFDVKEQWIDLNNLPQGSPLRQVEFFHRQMNEEVNGMECAARALVDFPETPWELRMNIARQCYDEARHVEMFHALLECNGGKPGQSPVMNFQYRIITNIDNLAGRLAVQNRSFEAEGVDAIEPAIGAAYLQGDSHLAEQYDAQLADEICHVRFANEHLSEAAAREPASVMRVGRALSYAAEAFSQVMGKKAMDAVDYAINKLGRMDAGFRAEEIQHATALRASRNAKPGTEKA